MLKEKAKELNRKYYQFTFPYPPDRGNRTGHSRWEKYGSKKHGRMSWHEFAIQSGYLNPQRIVNSQTLTYAIISAHFISPKRRRDFDNLVAMMKWPLDYLRQRRWISNDSAKRIWPIAFPTQRLAKNGESPKLVIEVMESNKKEVESLCAGMCGTK